MPKTTRAKSSPSTSQKVEEYIRQAIYSGQLKPRERIIEDDIARHLGCSRGPVREAVLRLERDGMVVATPRRGTYIRDVSEDEVEVVLSIRGKLEGLCARYMRERMTPESEAALRKCVDELKAATKKDSEHLLQADMKLHRTIWKLSHKEHLYNTLNFVMNPMFFLVARAYSSLQHTPEETYQNHAQYVETILSVPVSRVEHEVERYFKRLYQRLHKRVFHPTYADLGRDGHTWTAEILGE